jgi:DNA-binding PadR family transcriptional regulator
VPALSPQVFQILLSLADGPLHGYAMIQTIHKRAGDEFRLTASTLYDAIARLLDRGWIVETAARDHADDQDSRRRYYQLTAAGREAAKGEARRLEGLIALARSKRLLPSKRA